MGSFKPPVGFVLTVHSRNPMFTHALSTIEVFMLVRVSPRMRAILRGTSNKLELTHFTAHVSDDDNAVDVDIALKCLHLPSICAWSVIGDPGHLRAGLACLANLSSTTDWNVIRVGIHEELVAGYDWSHPPLMRCARFTSEWRNSLRRCIDALMKYSRTSWLDLTLYQKLDEQTCTALVRSLMRSRDVHLVSVAPYEVHANLLNALLQSGWSVQRDMLSQRGWAAI